MALFRALQDQNYINQLRGQFGSLYRKNGLEQQEVNRHLGGSGGVKSSLHNDASQGLYQQSNSVLPYYGGASLNNYRAQDYKVESQKNDVVTVSKPKDPETLSSPPEEPKPIEEAKETKKKKTL